MSQCSILSSSKTKYYTCLSKNEILYIMNSINIVRSINKSKIDLYNILKTELSKEERDWWEYQFIPINLRLKLKYIPFKPLGSKKKWGWLSMDDIDKIMYQYTLKLSKSKTRPFIYYGTKTSDHFIINPDEIDIIKNITKNGTNIGIILNTSPSNKKGEHWVSIFINNNILYYFDPVGDKPNKYIKQYIYKFKPKTDINEIEYQKKDGTCGLYAIEFLLLKANNKKIKLDKDKVINEKRKIYFVNSIT